MAIRYPDSKNKNSIQEGLEFQDFAACKLYERGIMAFPFASRRYQYQIGESLSGVEYKLDRRCTETGQLSIEIAEKTAATNSTFVNSGIYRTDNTWLYVQGNMSVLYVFAKSTLCLLHQTRRYREHTEPTIRAFFLPLAEAERYAALVINTKAN